MIDIIQPGTDILVRRVLVGAVEPITKVPVPGGGAGEAGALVAKDYRCSGRPVLGLAVKKAEGNE